MLCSERIFHGTISVSVVGDLAVADLSSSSDYSLMPSMKRTPLSSSGVH